MKMSVNSPIFKYLHFAWMGEKYSKKWLDWNYDELDTCRITNDLLKATFGVLFFSALAFAAGYLLTFLGVMNAIAIYEGMWWALLFSDNPSVMSVLVSVPIILLALFGVGLAIIYCIIKIGEADRVPVFSDIKQLASAKLDRFCARIELTDFDEPRK
jgi:hypothetical protein